MSCAQSVRPQKLGVIRNSSLYVDDGDYLAHWDDQLFTSLHSKYIPAFREIAIVVGSLTAEQSTHAISVLRAVRPGIHISFETKARHAWKGSDMSAAP
jgi:hypothetical protein